MRAHFHIKPRDNGEWGWSFVAENGEIMATSGGEGFTRRRDAVRSVRALVKTIGAGEFEIKLSDRE